MGIIYKATNLVNNKCYIGKTIQSLRIRKNKHKSDALSNKYNMYFHKSIVKHGFNNFKWEVLTKIDDENKLISRACTGKLKTAGKYRWAYA